MNQIEHNEKHNEFGEIAFLVIIGYLWFLNSWRSAGPAMVASAIPKTRHVEQDSLQTIWQLRLRPWGKATFSKGWKRHNTCVHADHDQVALIVIGRLIYRFLQPSSEYQTANIDSPFGLSTSPLTSAMTEGSCFGRHTKQRTQKTRSPPSMFLRAQICTQQIE